MRNLTQRSRPELVRVLGGREVPFPTFALARFIQESLCHVGGSSD